MTIQQELKVKALEALREKNDIRKDNIKYLLGLFETHSKNKDKTVDDPFAIGIIKNQLNGAKDTADMCTLDNKHADIYNKTVDFIELCQQILPTQANNNQIIEYLDTIDFSKLKNKNIAIGMCKKYFNGNVDSNVVKELLKEY